LIPGAIHQRVAQVDHVIDARAEEIVGGGAGKQHGRTPRKQPLLDSKLGVLRPQYHPRRQCSCGFQGFFRGNQLEVEVRVKQSDSCEAVAWGAASTGQRRQGGSAVLISTEF